MQAIVLRFVGILVVLMLVLVAAVRGVSGMIPNERSWLAWTSVARQHSFGRDVFVSDMRFSASISLQIDQNLEPLWSTDGQLAWTAIMVNEVDLSIESMKVKIWAGSRIVTLGDDLAHSYAIAWSDDGKLAYWSRLGNETRLFVWDGTRIIEVGQYVWDYSSILWSRDGRLAWTSNHTGNWEVYMWDGLNTVNASDSLFQESGTIHWTPDGKLLWLACDVVPSPRCTYTTTMWYIWDGEKLHQMNDLAYPTIVIDWSPRGQFAWMGYVEGDNNGTEAEVYIWSGENVEVVGVAPGLELLDWSHDEQLAWVGSNETGGVEIFVWNGSEVTQITNDQNAKVRLAWSDDGHLAWIQDYDGSSEVVMWDGYQVRNVSQTQEIELFFQWSPLGELIWATVTFNFTKHRLTMFDRTTSTVIWQGEPTSSLPSYLPLPP